MDLRNYQFKIDCVNYFIDQLSKKASKKGGKASVIDVWDVEDMLCKKFGLNDRQSGLVSALAINIHFS